MCPICFESFNDLEQIHIFRDCLHAFCKACLGEQCTQIINSGNIEKLRCPTSNEITHKPCETYIMEPDLRRIGMSSDLIDKASSFSLKKGIDTMDEFTWCPKTDCGNVAEVYQEKGYGECTWCYFKFCLRCEDTFHPFKRCRAAKVVYNGEDTADEDNPQH